MKLRFLFLTIIILSSLGFCSQNNIIYHIPINGTIDMGLPYYIKRAVNTAEENKASYIVFDIDTFGGRVDAATQIKDIILDSKINTIAFINKRAISAGALISLSCDSIFMTPGATIGAATAVDLKGNKASEKVISYMREEMASTAEANQRNRKIAIGMVDENINIKYIVDINGDTLTQKDIEGFSNDKLITLSTNSAVKLNIANKEITDFNNLLNHLNTKTTNVKSITESWSEKLVRFLTNPMVAPLFMSLGMLGLFMEIKSPGFGVPGLIGLLCLSLFFGSHLLVGLAEITEILILFIGILLILIEMFFIPGFGVIGIGGIFLIFYSFFKMLIGQYPSIEDYKLAYIGLSISIFISFIILIIMYNTFPKTEIYKKIIPFTPQKSSDGFSISKGYEKLIGSSGTTITDLRPSGRIIINDNIYQAISHGNYIDKDSKILVDGIDENQLKVKKI